MPLQRGRYDVWHGGVTAMMKAIHQPGLGMDVNWDFIRENALTSG